VVVVFGAKPLPLSAFHDSPRVKYEKPSAARGTRPAIHDVSRGGYRRRRVGSVSREVEAVVVIGSPRGRCAACLLRRPRLRPARLCHPLVIADDVVPRAGPDRACLTPVNDGDTSWCAASGLAPRQPVVLCYAPLGHVERIGRKRGRPGLHSGGVLDPAGPTAKSCAHKGPAAAARGASGGGERHVTRMR
jgi:hypothetical protein